MRELIKRYRKAIGGGIVAGAIAFAASLDHGTITGDEWGQIVGAIIAGAAGVAVTPANKPKREQRR